MRGMIVEVGLVVVEVEFDTRLLTLLSQDCPVKS